MKSWRNDPQCQDQSYLNNHARWDWKPGKDRVCFGFFKIVLFFGSMFETQGLVHVRQDLYPWPLAGFVLDSGFIF